MERPAVLGWRYDPLARKMKWTSSTIQDSRAASGHLPNSVELLVPCPDPSQSSFHLHRECGVLGEGTLRPSQDREPVLLDVYFPPWNKERVKSQA